MNNNQFPAGFDGDVNNSCVLEGGTQQVYISLDYELSLNKDAFIRLAGPQINPDMSVNEWNTFAEAVSHLYLDNVTIRGVSRALRLFFATTRLNIFSFTNFFLFSTLSVWIFFNFFVLTMLIFYVTRKKAHIFGLTRIRIIYIGTIGIYSSTWEFFV